MHNSSCTLRNEILNIVYGHLKCTGLSDTCAGRNSFMFKIKILATVRFQKKGYSEEQDRLHTECCNHFTNLPYCALYVLCGTKSKNCVAMWYRKKVKVNSIVLSPHIIIFTQNVTRRYYKVHISSPLCPFMTAKCSAVFPAERKKWKTKG